MVGVFGSVCGRELKAGDESTSADMLLDQALRVIWTTFSRRDRAKFLKLNVYVSLRFSFGEATRRPRVRLVLGATYGRPMGGGGGRQ